MDPSRRRAAGLGGEVFEQVLPAAQAGAAWAFERLFLAYSPAVASFCRRQGAADPDGTVNEVFLGVFRGLGDFVGGEPDFRGWLFTIAHRRVVDERRAQGRRVQEQLTEDLATGSIGGDVEAEALERMADERVRQLLGRLAPDQRDVLLLRVIGDLTVEQVASALGRSVGATKALQRRGLLALRKIVESEGVPL